MPAQDILVKFVDRYGQRTHQILAEQGLAPKLLYYGSPRLDDDGPSWNTLMATHMHVLWRSKKCLKNW